MISEEDVSEGKDFRFSNLTFKDPNTFIAGRLHTCIEEWEKLDTPDFVLKWLKQGVGIVSMFKHFKGNFKGKSYNIMILIFRLLHVFQMLESVEIMLFSFPRLDWKDSVMVLFM